MSAKGSSLRQLRKDGWKIHSELLHGKDAARAIAAEKSWRHDLVAAVEPISDVWAGKLETLGHMGRVEHIKFFGIMDRAVPADKRHRALIARHTVRLLRLDKFLAETQDGTVVHTPQSKPRGRKPGQGAMADGDAILEMHRLVTEEGLTALKAAESAANLAPGVATIEQKTKRIYDKYRGLWSN